MLDGMNGIWKKPNPQTERETERLVPYFERGSAPETQNEGLSCRGVLDLTVRRDRSEN